MTIEEKAKVTINTHGLLILRYEKPNGMRSFTEKERIICELALKNYWNGESDQQTESLKKEVEVLKEEVEVLKEVIRILKIYLKHV